MDIIYEGALDKPLIVPENLKKYTVYKKIYEVINYEYFKKSYVEFPEEFLLE